MSDTPMYSEYLGSELSKFFMYETEGTDRHFVNANGSDICPISKRHIQHYWTITYPDYGEVTYYCWGVGYQSMRDKRGR